MAEVVPGSGCEPVWKQGPSSGLGQQACMPMLNWKEKNRAETIPRVQGVGSLAIFGPATPELAPLAGVGNSRSPRLHGI